MYIHCILAYDFTKYITIHAHTTIHHQSMLVYMHNIYYNSK